MIPNTNYSNLKDSYLFYNIAQKTKAYLEEHPGSRLYRMGIGDVSLPLCDAVIQKLHEAVDDQAKKSTFHGYMPECGDPALRKSIADYYRKRGVELSDEEVFVSSGASDELGDILDLLGGDKTVLIMEPAYPAYGCKYHCREIRSSICLPGEKNDFYRCRIKVFRRMSFISVHRIIRRGQYLIWETEAWVDYAADMDAIILFDAAYEAFIEEENLPHSIFEISGAEKCAIEICSLSKTAGFTGTRCGYTVIPKELVRGRMNLNEMWVRNRTTKTNGVSYIIQKGAAAVFTEEGQKQIHANIKVYKENAAYLMRALDQLGIWYCGGKNAPYIWMKCPENMGSWEFFDYLLQNIQVVGTPGEGFGSGGEGYFRFSTFGSPEDTKEAADRLVKLLSKS